MRIAAAMPRRGAAIVRGEADPEAANPQALLIMADSVEASLLSFLNACVGAAFNLNRAEAASVVSIVFAGETVGALVAGPLSDKTGRKGISLASAFGVAVFGFGSAFAQSYAAFVTLRLLVGVFIGTFAVPFDLLAEQLPASIRGRALMWVQVGWSIGAMYCCAAAWVTLPIWSWRSLTLACAIPPMIIFLALVYFLDESPRWFLEVGRRKDAAEVFRRIAVKNGRGDDPKVMEAIAEIERDDDDVAKEESSLQLFHDAWTQYKALWDAKRRCTTAAVWAVWFGFGLAYYGVTLLVTRIYDYADDDDDFKCKFRYWQIFVVFSAEFVGTVALVPFIDSVGRVRSRATRVKAASAYMGRGRPTKPRFGRRAGPERVCDVRADRDLPRARRARRHRERRRDAALRVRLPVRRARVDYRGVVHHLGAPAERNRALWPCLL